MILKNTFSQLWYTLKNIHGTGQTLNIHLVTKFSLIKCVSKINSPNLMNYSNKNI